MTDDRLDAFGNPATPADVEYANRRAGRYSSMPVEPLAPRRVVFRDTDPRPRGLDALIPTAPNDQPRTASGKRAGVLPFARLEPERDALDLAEEIRAGDFEDRGWMIDALDRAEFMLRAFGAR